MKAYTLQKNGGIENFTLSDVSKPVIQPNEVLVQVRAISINPVDSFVRQYRQSLQNIMRPEANEESFILGWDISGIVVETGNNVHEFKNGDEVFGMVNFPGNGKAYAEYVAAPANQMALKPKNISHEEAAAATLAALTAWQGLVENAKIKSGDKVLIHGAGGGVGHYAVQIAKSFGAYVIGSGSASKKDIILKLGADEFFDYNSGKFEDQINDADIVFDSIQGADHLMRSIEATKNGGTVVSIKSMFEGEIAEKANAKGLKTCRILVNSNGNDIRQIARLLEEGKIHSHVSKKYKFEDLPEAHLQIETGKTTGKVVVVV